MYTGTGTAEDPYMVTTLADLYTCAAIEGAHVCIADDISASSEEAYAAGTDSPLAIACAHLYGADGGKRVTGLVVGGDAQNLIVHSGAGTTEMELIDFVDCVFTRPTVDAAQAVDLLLRDMTIKDCNFSYAVRQADVLGASVLIGGDLTSCTVYVKGTTPRDRLSGGQQTLLFYPDSAHGCNFEAHGLHAYSTPGALPMIANATKCLFLVEDLKLYHSTIGGPYIASDCDTCAFAISQQKMDSITQQTGAGFDNMTGVNIVDAEFWESIETGGFTLIDSGNVYQLSTQQMKSAAYLTEIGFLP